ncbi:MAG: cell wall hydrolase [Lachnospiraceae bacterium]
MDRIYMYKKYVCFIVLCNCIFLTVIISLKGIKLNRLALTPAFQVHFIEDFVEEKRTSFLCQAKEASSGQRIVDYQVLEKDMIIELSSRDYQVLQKIVEAEAGCEDEKGKLLVANVVINRVKSDQFPNTVTEVVFQKENGTTQFSPIYDGSYQQVSVSEETKQVVDRALLGEDISKGALYFAARSYADPERMKWFDTHLTLLFSYGGHEFFR